MTDHTPLNYNQITPYIWLGTNMCCLMHGETLRRSGFDADIDLEANRPEAPPQVKIYLWLPTPDAQAPSLDQIEAGVSLITTLVQAGRKIYLHCKNGHGRAPTLLAAYLISTGCSIEKAINLIKERRPAIHLNEAQRAALVQFQKSFLKQV